MGASMRPLSPQELEDKYVTPEPMSGCWLWSGGISRDRYGVVTHHRKTRRASHIIWTLHTGEIVPSGKCLLHKCDTPQCVNPKHLFVGTKTENNADRDKKGRTVCGNSQWKAKLTPEIVSEIRKSAASCAVEGRRYGVTKSTISKVRRMGTWKHVV